MRTLPYDEDRKTRDQERANHVLGRKTGGRVKDDGDTNIHIEVNAAPKEGQEADMPMAGPIPPPMMPPPMAGPPPPPMGGGMGAGPPGPIAMRRGGRAKDCAPGMAKGGKAPAGPSIQLAEGGAGGGMGRLDKAKAARRKS